MEKAGDILKASLAFVAGAGRESVLNVIKQEHREAAALLDDAVAMDPGDAKMVNLAKKIEAALTQHVTIEERVFYGPLRRRAENADERVDMFEAYTEHELVRHLIELLRSGRRDGERFKAELQVLAENVKHHVKEEESTVFGLARDLFDEEELDRMGRAWRKAKGERVPPERKAPAARKTTARTTAAPARKKATTSKTATRKTATRKTTTRKKR
jgi:hemerythrin-like domain-containing protein